MLNPMRIRQTGSSAKTPPRDPTGISSTCAEIPEIARISSFDGFERKYQEKTKKSPTKRWIFCFRISLDFI
ncbi:MAG: hypothetical protein AAB390_02015 [Patescibacteria group bacterium]